MDDRRRDDNGPWRGWFFSVLLGLFLAMLCLNWLNRRATPVYLPSQEAVDAHAANQRSVGFEFSLGFRILLPGKAE